MSSSRIDLKNPALAAVLAWLVPGLGHAYQGRWFKAALYSICIWSTFGCGWVLGDGKVVYYNTDLKRGRRPIGYAAQVMVGVASLPAFLQTSRATPRDEMLFRRENISLERPLAGEIEGVLVNAQYQGGHGHFKFRGQIEIEPSTDGGFDARSGVAGRLTGTLSKIDEAETNLPDGTEVDLKITFLRSLEPEIFPSPHRELQCDVKGQLLGPNGGDFEAGLKGKILNVRSIWNRYAAPLDAEGVEATHGDLGKFFEIGLVYTWIAGLLNLLAIWDAYEGPAYGYGDEEAPPAGSAPPPGSGGPGSGTDQAIATGATAPATTGNPDLIGSGGSSGGFTLPPTPPPTT